MCAFWYWTVVNAQNWGHYYYSRPIFTSYIIIIIIIIIIIAFYTQCFQLKYL